MNTVSAPDVLLLVLYVVGCAELIAAAVSLWVVRIPDQPAKPFLVALAVVGSGAVAAAPVVWVGLGGMAEAFLARGPGPQHLLAAWLWLTSLAPVWLRARHVVMRHRPTALARMGSRVRPLDRSVLSGRLERFLARWDFSRLHVTSLELHLPRLPSAFEGLRVAQVSDIHYGPEVVGPLMELVVEEVSAFRPDLIALTGDLVADRRGVGPAAQLAATLRAPLGAYAVLGNHDFWAAARELPLALEEHGVRVLRNRGVRLERGPESLWLAGVDDFWSRSHDLTSALAGRRDGEFCLLLAHNPDHIMEAARAQVNLQLSGHTHGGQVVLPVLGPLIVPSRHGRRFVQGLHQVGPTVLYVSRGIGARLPLRIGSAPELVLLTLRAWLEVAGGPAAKEEKETGNPSPRTPGG